MLLKRSCDLIYSANKRVQTPLQSHVIRFGHASRATSVSSWRTADRSNRVSWVGTSAAISDVGTLTGAVQTVILTAYNSIPKLVPWDALLGQPWLVLALALLLLRFLPPIVEVASRGAMVLAALLVAWIIFTHPTETLAYLYAGVELTLRYPVQASLFILAGATVFLAPYLVSGVLLVSLTLWLLAVTLPL